MGKLLPDGSGDYRQGAVDDGRESVVLKRVDTVTKV